MRLKRSLTLGLLLLAGAMQAQEGCGQEENCCIDYDNWYVVVGSGYAFTHNSNVTVNDPTFSFWADVVQGYQSNLGHSPFFFAGFGRTLWNWFELDVTYSYYLPFHYQKYQTNVGNPAIHRTRFFDIEHQNLMFDFTFDPDCYLTWNWGCLDIRPIAGAGIGVAISQMSNFHTVHFNSTVAAVGSVDTIGVPLPKTTDFAWQFLAALRFGINAFCPFILDIGYRYYDGGRFCGPEKIVQNQTTGALETVSHRWSGRIRANEVYATLNTGF